MATAPGDALSLSVLLFRVVRIGSTAGPALSMLLQRAHEFGVLQDCLTSREGPDGSTLLHVAAGGISSPAPPPRSSSGKPAPLRDCGLACSTALLRAGIDVSLVDAKGRTYAHIAAGAGNAPLLDMLRRVGNSSEAQCATDAAGRTPAFHALLAGQDAGLEWCLNASPHGGAQEAVRRDGYGTPLLHYAVNKSDVRSVRMLLAAVGVPHAAGDVEAGAAETAGLLPHVATPVARAEAVLRALSATNAAGVDVCALARATLSARLSSGALPQCVFNLLLCESSRSCARLTVAVFKAAEAATDPASAQRALHSNWAALACAYVRTGVTSDMRRDAAVALAGSACVHLATHGAAYIIPTVAVSAITSSTLHILPHIQSLLGVLLYLTLVSLSLASLLFYARMRVVEPGVIIPLHARTACIAMLHGVAATSRRAYEQGMAGGVDPSMLLNGYCVTCAIARPARTKHCVTCGVCIQRFDHCCPWTGGCVGQRNHGIFIALVAAAGGAAGVWMLLLLVYIISSGVSVWGHMRAAPVWMLLSLQPAWMAIFAALLILTHLRLMVVNLTTNEQLNHSKYGYMRDSRTGAFKNPFVRAHWWENVVDFWNGTEPILPVAELQTWGHTAVTQPRNAARAIVSFMQTAWVGALPLRRSHVD